MKVEHIASSSEPSFYKRLVKILANEKIDVIDVNYSTAALKTRFDEDEPVQYSALILYEEEGDIYVGVDYDEIYQKVDL